jgi:hypothetical protein
MLVGQEVVMLARLLALALTLTLLVATAAGAFTVHEWGTFTSRHGADGVAQLWNPLEAVTDLPRFVNVNPRIPKRVIEGNVRMETPVLYFYADARTTVSVDVDFPRGTMSEWYPRVKRTRDGIRWPKVTVLPGATASLPDEGAPSHYYAARNTEAAIVRCRYNGKTQHEKFLFYRGVGTFDLPLAARVDGDDVVVRAAPGVSRVVVVERRGDVLGHSAHDVAPGETSVPRPAPGVDTRLAFEADLAGLLVAEGLYEAEARAMIDTWRDTWSADGIRVLYMVPRAFTDAVLPLRITPAPDDTVRVLVGRAELV